jgi:hypothetical protein
MLLEWIAMRFKSYRMRMRMRSRANFLVKVRALKPEVLSYLESLEFQVDRQEKEMRLLRWALEGEQMANWDLVQDVRDARPNREDDSIQTG